MKILRNLLLLLIPFFSISTSFSQATGKKEFYTKNWRYCDSSVAIYYSITELKAEDAGVVSTFFMDGILKSRVSYSCISKKIENGIFQNFGKEGEIISQFTYLEGKKNGVFFYYFDTGEINIQGKYAADSLQDSLCSYYKNGASRRKDFYAAGKLKDGKCFTASGLDTAYFAYEIDAEFPDGTQGLMRWIQTNMQYPQDAIEDNIQGRVYVSFVVGKKGVVSDIQIERGVASILDKEVIRLIGQMPDWKPAELDGFKVSSKMRLPISFRLD
jgi:TonB family protein